MNDAAVAAPSTRRGWAGVRRGPPARTPAARRAPARRRRRGRCRAARSRPRCRAGRRRRRRRRAGRRRRTGRRSATGWGSGRSAAHRLTPRPGRAGWRRGRRGRCPTGSPGPTRRRSCRGRTAAIIRCWAFSSVTEEKIGSRREELVAREVHLGDQALGERRAEQREVDVRGTPGVVVVAPRVGARLDRHEPVAALVVGQAAPAADEVRVQRRRVQVAVVAVAPGGVGLPDLDELPAHRPPGRVQDPAGDDDALPQRLPGGVLREVGVERGHVGDPEHGRGALDGARRRDDERLGRRAQGGRAVRRVRAVRMAAAQRRQAPRPGGSPRRRGPARWARVGGARGRCPPRADRRAKGSRRSEWRVSPGCERLTSVHRKRRSAGVPTTDAEPGPGPRAARPARGDAPAAGSPRAAG